MEIQTTACWRIWRGDGWQVSTGESGARSDISTASTTRTCVGCASESSDAGTQPGFRGLFNEKVARSYVAALGNAQDRLESLTDIKTGQALLRELGLGREIERILHVALVERARVRDEDLVRC